MKIVLENEFDKELIEVLFKSWMQRKTTRRVVGASDIDILRQIDAVFEEHGWTPFESRGNMPPEFIGESFDVLVSGQWMHLSVDDAIRLKELLGDLIDNKAKEKL